MISKEIILVSAEADIDLLWTMIDREHLDREATEKIKRILHRFIGEKLSLVIEYPYYDCDYLSTYYIYYAKKRKKHAKECYRIHLVKGDDTYFGYFVLRPSSINKVARAYLRPDVCFDEAYLILTYYTVNYMGQETEVAAFPWISQETDVNVCAHVALLTVSRFFGNRFKNYADRRMGDIVCDAPRMTNRSLPTESLCGFQISEILRKCGFTPLVLKRAGDVKFNQAVLSYVESGIPVIALVKNHAVTIIGHGSIRSDYVVDRYNRSPGHVNSSEFVQELIIQDDNCIPYQSMKIDQEAVRPDNSQTAAQLYPDVSYYTLADIEMAFVPLYDRMYLTFRSIAARVNELLDSQQTDQNRTSSQKIPPYGFPAKCCYRMYITSSNSLKKEAFNNREMNEQLKGIIIGSVLPRFVWCVDISTLDEYNSNLISARIVIDTTENSNELNPWLIIHDREKVVYYGEDGKWAIIDQDNQGRVLSIQPYGAYINNLAHIKKIEVKS